MSMLSKAEEQRVLEMPTLGYASMLGGVEIKRIEEGIDTYVICVANAWGGKPTVHRRMVDYTVAGRPFIRIGNSPRVYLDEVIRC